jgi:hypothetical protein
MFVIVVEPGPIVVRFGRNVRLHRWLSAECHAAIDCAPGLEGDGRRIAQFGRGRAREARRVQRDHIAPVGFHQELELAVGSALDLLVALAGRCSVGDQERGPRQDRDNDGPSDAATVEADDAALKSLALDEPEREMLGAFTRLELARFDGLVPRRANQHAECPARPGGWSVVEPPVRERFGSPLPIRN